MSPLSGGAPEAEEGGGDVAGQPGDGASGARPGGDPGRAAEPTGQRSLEVGGGNRVSEMFATNSVVPLLSSLTNHTLHSYLESDGRRAQIWVNGALHFLSLHICFKWSQGIGICKHVIGEHKLSSKTVKRCL